MLLAKGFKIQYLCLMSGSRFFLTQVNEVFSQVMEMSFESVLILHKPAYEIVLGECQVLAYLLTSSEVSYCWVNHLCDSLVFYVPRVFGFKG
ncbi:hypothetical protein GOP47_0020767 [Adiantum capillus-veneris]|uniref:Uncharacterized protein n=1 Tax=Adiantum capillus-veneris TaxID=13818 RepID=A0A9D4UA61_ADICA|nr:hypothetical protein GOP47_0020767 [Adiantum capillus-veneris]